MQETLLRRDRDDHAPVDQQNGLAKLQVPIPQREPLALESRNGKVRSFEEVEYRFRVAGVRSRGRFADHAHGGPSLHVRRGHMPRIQFQKAVLHLYRAPLILRRVPACWHQTRRAGDRSRIPSPVGQVRCEDLAFVRRDENVIGWRLLGEHRHLTLDQSHAAVGVSGATGVLEGSLLYNLCAET